MPSSGLEVSRGLTYFLLILGRCSYLLSSFNDNSVDDVSKILDNTL